MASVIREDLARRAWAQFTEGYEDEALVEATFTAQNGWEQLVSSSSPPVALGSLLIWLRTHSQDFLKEHVGQMLEKVNPACRATAEWLTVHLTKGDPVSHYRRDEWEKLLNNEVPVNYLESIIEGATPYERYQMHSGLLQLFEQDDTKRGHIVQTVLDWAKHATAGETVEWMSELLTYLPLLNALFQVDPRFALWGNYNRAFLRTSGVSDVGPTIRAARGSLPSKLDESRFKIVAEPGDKLMDWPDSPTWLDADNLADGHRSDLLSLAGSLGVPVYDYRSPDNSWEGMVRWDPHHLRPSIVLREPQATSRRRFTFAHELGHLWLNTMKMDVAESVQHFWRDDTERNANKFASSLLIPSAALAHRKYWDGDAIRGLAESYGVSFQVAAIRVISVYQNYGLIVGLNDVVRWSWLGESLPKVDVSTYGIKDTVSAIRDEGKKWRREFRPSNVEVVALGEYSYIWISG